MSPVLHSFSGSCAKMKLSFLKYCKGRGRGLMGFRKVEKIKIYIYHVQVRVKHHLSHFELGCIVLDAWHALTKQDSTTGQGHCEN